MCCDSYDNITLKKVSLHREIAHDHAVGCVNTVLILARGQTKKGAKSLRPSCYWEEGLAL